MSTSMQASTKRMPAEQLSSLLLSPNANKVAVVDVRDADHIGGHIKGSHHVPSTDLDNQIPKIVKTLADKETVIFHCALSQERGPRAARRYKEEKDKESEEGKKDDALKVQEVYVLDRGFVGWQDKYGTDERLTEAYAPDIWVDY